VCARAKERERERESESERERERVRTDEKLMHVLCKLNQGITYSSKF